MAALVLVLLAALGGRAVLPGARSAAPLADLRSQISGVESLLEEFRRQLQQEEPGPPPAAAGGGGERCGGSGGFSARPDSIIRTKDSIAAGATFLRAPDGAAGWRQCLDACCAEPRCTLAVVQGPGRPRAAAELGCFLFNCTHRGRPVCPSPQPKKGVFSCLIFLSKLFWSPAVHADLVARCLSLFCARVLVLW